MDGTLRQLKGIGARKEALFARLGIQTISDLLQYFPREYEDRSRIWPIGSAPPHMAYWQRAGAVIGARAGLRHSPERAGAAAAAGHDYIEGAYRRRQRRRRADLVQPAF